MFWGREGKKALRKYTEARKKQVACSIRSDSISPSTMILLNQRLRQLQKELILVMSETVKYLLWILPNVCASAALNAVVQLSADSHLIIILESPVVETAGLSITPAT